MTSHSYSAPSQSPIDLECERRQMSQRIEVIYFTVCQQGGSVLATECQLGLIGLDYYY